jgi:uncharacterized protein (DUF433 family)
MTLPDYLEQDNDFIRLKGHRIGLNHIVRSYRKGFSAEMIAEEYPTLGLAQIHKTIAFYLENQAEVDAYIAAQDERFAQESAEHLRPGPGITELRDRLARRKSNQAGV